MALIINESMPKACSWYDEEGHCIRCFNYGACPYEKIDCFPKRPPRCPILGEIPDEHGRLVDIDRMISESRRKNLPIQIESTDELADFLETYADLGKTDHTVVVEASK